MAVSGANNVTAMYDVFISHNRKQKSWVRKFCRALRRGDLRVFFDEDSIGPGESIVRAIEKAIQDSNHVVLVISPSSLTSKWVAMETALAVYGDPDASRRVLIPVILEPVETRSIPLSVRSLNHVDLTDPSTRGGRFKRLLAHLGLHPNRIPPSFAWPEPLLEKEEIELKSLSAASIDDVISWGWDGHRLLDELIRLDYETIEGLTLDHEGQTSQWARVFMDHPDTWRLIVDGQESIVGYWHFAPLFESEFELARQGRLLDSHITADKIRLFELPGQYDMYFVSICIQARFRRTPAVHLLFSSLLRTITGLARQGVFFRDVCANAYTPSGAAICRSFGMEYVRDHVSHGQVYVRKFYPFPEHGIFNDFAALVQLYAEKFR